MLGILGISWLIKVTKVATLGIDDTEDRKFTTYYQEAYEFLMLLIKLFNFVMDLFFILHTFEAWLVYLKLISFTSLS